MFHFYSIVQIACLLSRRLVAEWLPTIRKVGGSDYSSSDQVKKSSTGKTRPDLVMTRPNRILPDPNRVFKQYLHWIPVLSSVSFISPLSLSLSLLLHLSSPLFLSSSSPFHLYFTTHMYIHTRCVCIYRGFWAGLCARGWALVYYCFDCFMFCF